MGQDESHNVFYCRKSKSLEISGIQVNLIEKEKRTEKKDKRGKIKNCMESFDNIIFVDFKNNELVVSLFNIVILTKKYSGTVKKDAVCNVFVDYQL